MVVAPPGPRARALSRRLARLEAPGVNTVGGGAALLWEEARGANVLDVDGNRYVDLTSGFGVALVGHRHPAVVAAVRRQSVRLLHGLGDVHAHPDRVEIAAALVERAPMRDAAVYFAISGSDAVEVGLKTALLATGRPGVLAFTGGYHGLTLGSLAAGGRADFRAPFAAHLHRHAVRLPYGCPASALDRALSGAGRRGRGAAIGCVLVEPIQGRAGVVVPPGGWLAELAALARRHGALLLADELLTGAGRTGPFFACAAEGVEPDLLCAGKALAGGLPLAALLGRRELLAAWPAGGEALHTATFLAHPLACAAALATLRVIDSPAHRRRAAELAGELAAGLQPLRALPGVRDVRGRGLLWGIELARPGAAVAWARRAAEAGVLALPAGAEGRVLELLPPAVTTSRQLGAALAGLRGTVPGAHRSSRAERRMKAP
jgi:4-aminobutyrate aminotransferase-like enzyme